MKQKGFTLIELIVVVLIIAILAAIAVPNYQMFMIRNAEADAKAQMGQIQLQLDRWRATKLSYRGFVPNTGKVDDNGNLIYDVGGINGTIIYVPFGSTADNYRYQIELVDGDDNASSLNPSGDTILVARSWVMRATPNPNGVAKDKGRVFLQRSTGLKCATLVATEDALPITHNDCTNTSLETW